MNRVRLALLLAWLAGSLLASACLYSGGTRTLAADLAAMLGGHLQQSLDASYFGDSEHSISDVNGIRRVAGRINQALQSVVATRWYAPQQACRARIERIGDVSLGQQPGRLFPFEVDIGGSPRPVSLALSCSPRWWPAVAASGLLALLFALIYRCVPAPLTASHRDWINRLVAQGYSGDSAFAAVSGYGPQQLALNPVQQRCLEQLCQQQDVDYLEAFRLALDPRVAALDGTRLDWFLLGISRDGVAAADRALALARAGDSVEIDLAQMQLAIRGLPVPLTKTLLLYYAWYARKRLEGDGWVSNPASNRPDREAGAELAAMMLHYGGHGRAINDLEEHGLKARTLDQNRSKLREEIQAVLGEALSAHYLFESERQEEPGRARYRLRCPPAQIALREHGA